MDKYFVQTREFSKEIDYLIKKRSLLTNDFNDFKRHLSENPKIGSIIVGSGGVRKVRLKSASREKSGGFRVCYYYSDGEDYIFLLWIYPKNEQDNLTDEQKNILKSLVTSIKCKDQYE